MTVSSANEPDAKSHVANVSLKPTRLLFNGIEFEHEFADQESGQWTAIDDGQIQVAYPGMDSQGVQLGAHEKEQIRQLRLLDTNQMQLARLFAGHPTFDTALKNLLVSRMKVKIPEREFRTSPLPDIDPDHCYVNHFAVDALGGRSLTSSQSFTEVMLGCLATDAPANYKSGDVGFFSRPDSVEEDDSLFVSPLAAKIPAIMESVFYLAEPTTNDHLKRQLRDDLVAFGNSKNSDVLETPTPSTNEKALAYLLSRRYLHFMDLNKADRNPAIPLSQDARTQQNEEDRLLDLITTHPSKADRSRLMRAPIPHVYCVMLDMGTAPPQKWPAAMVIKRTDRNSLFLYSLEGGFQRFQSFQDLVNQVSPTFAGQKRGIRDISSEVSGSVFDVAADDLLQSQRSALDTVLNAPGNEKLTLAAFALKVEDAQALPNLALAGPLAVRQETLVENNRPDFYKTATRSEKANCRRLEKQVLEAVYKLSSLDIQTLRQFTRQKVKQYLQLTVHPGINPDSDTTLVTLSYGKNANPRQSRTRSLTELMLENLRPLQYPNAMREVTAVYLADSDGHRIRHPASGFMILLTGGEIAKMARGIDAGGSYEAYLREKMNKPEYKTAWQAAYLANLKLKAYEAELGGHKVFKTTVFDSTFKPPMSRKLLRLWLDAIIQSPLPQTRALVQGRRVYAYGLLLGGSLGAGGQHGTMGNAFSVDGVLIFSDQDGPDIKGTVGAYFPDSPDGQDLYEFSSLSNGIAGLLQQEQWQGYFRSRISATDPEEVKRVLGQRRGQPLIRCMLIPSDLLEFFHKAHLNFHRAYADHRSNSNQDVQRQASARILMVAMEIFMDLAGMLLVPGFQLLRSALKTGLLIVKTGAVPMNLTTLVFLHRVANYGGRGMAGVTVPVRGQSSFLAVTARQSQDEVIAGLPLEEALYRRYAVTDTSVIKGVTADPQGFYRPKVSNHVSGGVDRPVFVQQPDGTVFRVHDHTKLKATEATLVDPATGLSIRSSGVMRSTVARMPNGEWRAVGFGRGGGERPAKQPSETDPSKPNVPAPSSSAISDLIRTSGVWNTQVMELVPGFITRLPIWPQNRGLLIVDEITAHQSWSVRFTPGQTERIYPTAHHPDQVRTDIVLRRSAQNHYNLVLGNRVVRIPADGDCFFNAIARGLNEGQSQATFSMQGLRNAAADFFDQNPELNQYLVAEPTPVQQALFENGPWLDHLLDTGTMADLTRIIYGGPNPHGLFEPMRNFLALQLNVFGRRTLRAARGGDLPIEILHEISRHLSPRPPQQLMPSSTPYYDVDEQTLRYFFADTLLAPIDDFHLARLLRDEFLRLSQGVMHIMLEYGVKAVDLANNHPKNKLGYVMFDQDTHAHLSANELDTELEGAYMVDRDDLDKVQQRYQRETGQFVDDDDELMDQFIYYQRAESVRDLLLVSLQRFPDLLRRAQILMQSSVVSSNLDGMLPVSVVARWLRDPALSDNRLRIIAEYADTRYAEVVRRSDIYTNWMHLFDDTNLQNILTHQEALTQLWKFMGHAQPTAEEGDHSVWVKLFSASGQTPSNSRMSILFDTPDLWRSLQAWPSIHVVQIWDDLVGPHFSDSAIQLTLSRPGVLRSALDFVVALRSNLTREEEQANRIVMEVLTLSQSQAQQYLYRFDFPTDRLGHSRSDFVLYLEDHMAVPDWAWQYLREGVTRQSLTSLGEMKPKSE
ncbi:OTU domain-containing protein [Pseudomonas brassicacearum]|uniref:OTU domain-containing protein n=1 Tax=Pseudomonas brassicacearum TaxID=930166 RepID=UPI001D97E0CF|nr:OTU domain-containing protein [Pseudomonas brassicacearum]CAH0128278.1 hypothetical protein SRABI06_00159 [Pseudomonas brassicacearum]